MQKTILYERKDVNGAVGMRLLCGSNDTRNDVRAFINEHGFKYSHRCSEYSVYKTIPDIDGISYTIKVYYK